ncbi:SDR family NAD(P)-dependent oxidoreductase [Ruegeria arenilitoris]|uniref:SDR family NAD(P)-dependent oxidoreductase n=1 Tax=Ruegeria arenilitoris TaxID=1173585 RepID=UPI001480870B
MELNNTIALVTGSASGLGAATAKHFAAHGARVAVLDFNEAQANAVAEELKGFAVATDVRDEAAVAEAFESVSNFFGSPPRIVVNCAGVGMAARIVGREDKLSFDVFEQTLRVNLFGTYNVMSHAALRIAKLSSLEDGERGVIINTSSVAWEDGQLGQTAYAASKGAITAMSLPAAREFAQSGIRVMAIAPGLFNTPMMEGLPEDVAAKITANIPFPARLGEANEFALLAKHIVQNPFLNGTTIRLDGAVRLPPR